MENINVPSDTIQTSIKFINDLKFTLKNFPGLCFRKFLLIEIFWFAGSCTWKLQIGNIKHIGSKIEFRIRAQYSDYAPSAFFEKVSIEFGGKSCSATRELITIMDRQNNSSFFSDIEKPVFIKYEDKCWKVSKFRTKYDHNLGFCFQCRSIKFLVLECH